MGLQETLAALADPTRRRILQALQNAGRLTTGQLADQVRWLFRNRTLSSIRRCVGYVSRSRIGSFQGDSDGRPHRISANAVLPA